jgi:hypothetical protein
MAAPVDPGREGGDGARVSVTSGRAFRVTWEPIDAPVTPALADEVRRVLERFAREAGFDERRPVPVLFKPGVVGHHKVGRAADIYGVGGLGLETWMARWLAARARMRQAATADEAAAIEARERRENLGWRLYRALQQYGRWSQPYGYPIQLFGPWSRSVGPWRYISDFLLKAHWDHIHMAK